MLPLILVNQYINISSLTCKKTSFIPLHVHLGGDFNALELRKIDFIMFQVNTLFPSWFSIKSKQRLKSVGVFNIHSPGHKWEGLRYSRNCVLIFLVPC